MSAKCHLFAGLDLGQTQDYTALVILEQTIAPTTNETNPRVSYDYSVRHLHRWPLGTPYPTIVTELGVLFGKTYELRQSTLVIDATGVGRPVVDMIIAADLRIPVKAFSITAGLKPGNSTVPKKDLVGAVQALLQQRRLKILRTLPLADSLVKELEMFRVTVTPGRNETFAIWRERDHDDLVLALALAIWYGQKNPGFQGPVKSFHPYLQPDPFRTRR